MLRGEKLVAKLKSFLLFFCKYFRLYFSAFSLVFFVGILKWACVCMCESVTMMCWQQQQQHTERASCCCCHRWTYLLRGHIVGARTQIDACIRVDAGQDEEDTCRRICIKNIYICGASRYILVSASHSANIYSMLSISSASFAVSLPLRLPCATWVWRVCR